MRDLIRVRLKKAVAELITTTNVGVTVHHLDLVVEETATLLIIRIVDHFDPGIWKGKESLYLSIHLQSTSIHLYLTSGVNRDLAISVVSTTVVAIPISVAVPTYLQMLKWVERHGHQICRIIVILIIILIITVMPIPAWSMMGKSFQKEGAIVKPWQTIFQKLI